MAPFLLLKTGSLEELGRPYMDRHGDTERSFFAATGLDPEEMRVIDVERDEALPAMTDPIAGVIVTGSGAMVTEGLPWMKRSGAWLVEAVKAGIPVLGVCFGHQLMAQALGGAVGENPKGLESGTLPITIDAAGDPLLGPLPHRVMMQVHHYQTVLTSPPGAQELAHSAQDPHQALRYGPVAWSIQFHPEITRPMMVDMLDLLRHQHAAEGYDPTAMMATTQDTPEGPVLMRRFVDIARQAR
ncbi:glutamine amidotransferase [Chachezhania sediminis]|uniref:glutamine amidotransferase n=1 Tax=Chachezhania sediminis TaxID=2599291 RepID=UPI00131CFD8A|nr:glutamine amidotransferase [Chachezhania sediminis]